MSDIADTLARLNALHAKATPGVWNHLGYAGQDGTIQGPMQVVIASFSSAWGKSQSTGHQAFADCASVVAMHNEWPAIAAHIAAHAQRIADLEAAASSLLAFTEYAPEAQRPDVWHMRLAALRRAIEAGQHKEGGQ